MHLVFEKEKDTVALQKKFEKASQKIGTAEKWVKHLLRNTGILGEFVEGVFTRQLRKIEFIFS